MPVRLGACRLASKPGQPARVVAGQLACWGSHWLLPPTKGVIGISSILRLTAIVLRFSCDFDAETQRLKHGRSAAQKGQLTSVELSDEGRGGKRRTSARWHARAPSGPDDSGAGQHADEAAWATHARRPRPARRPGCSQRAGLDLARAVWLAGLPGWAGLPGLASYLSY